MALKGQELLLKNLKTFEDDLISLKVIKRFNHQNDPCRVAIIILVVSHKLFISFQFIGSILRGFILKVNQGGLPSSMLSHSPPFGLHNSMNLLLWVKGQKEHI